jgi:hypothetical protein
MKTNLKGLLAAAKTIFSSSCTRFSVVLLSCLLWTSVGWGQVANYAFSQSNGTYTPITGGVNISSTTASTLDDNVNSSALPIGFTFIFNGVSYSDFGYNANGWISLGSTLPVTSSTPISNTSTTYPVLSAFGIDLIGRVMLTGNRTSGSNAVTVTAGDITQISVGDGISGSGIPSNTTITGISGSTITMSANATSGSTGFSIRVTKQNAGIRYETTGIAPNRKLVVQWSGFNRYATLGAFGEVINFQIILNETSNIIDFVYNILGPSSTTTLLPQVGIRGLTNSEFNCRSSTTSWTSTTNSSSNSGTLTYSNTIKPTSGLTYTWTPPSPCTAPTSLAASVSSSSQTFTSISGSFTAASSAPTGYIVVRSTSATQPTTLALGTTLPTVGNTSAFGTGTYVEYVGTSAGSWVSTGLSAGTTYYYYVFCYNNTSCTGGPAYSASATSFSQSTTACTGAALANLTYTSATNSYCTGNAITTNTATLGTTSGVPIYSISPALPTGLSLNTSTGAITGTPTTAQSATSYTVTADNGCTNTTTSISIEILTSPSAPSSAAATSVMPLSFTANWAAASGASSYILDVATDNTFTNFVTGYNALNVGNVISYSVTGLNAGTTYYYRVRTTNGTCNSANSSIITVSTSAITSVATGNWNATTTWNSGTVPTCTDNVTIASTHTVTVNSSSNVSKNLTINSGATLVIASGDLTVGCTLNNTPLTNNGTLTVSGGTLNVNGNVNNANGSFFNQSGGIIIVDGNAGGVIANSVPAGTNIFGFGTSGTGSTLNLSAGSIIIVDPHTANTAAGGTSNGHSFAYWGNGYRAGVNHTIQLGNGISTDPGGNTSGYQFNTWPGTGYFISGNLIIDAPTGTNRFVSGNYSIGIERNLLVTNGEIRLPSPSKISGDISVSTNGILTSTGFVELCLWGSDLTSSSSSSASTISQTISGSGTFRNSTTSSTANLSSLTINNSNATGVTLAVPLSLSGTLTMTAGKINTTATNLLTLGTTTAAGSLTYTAGQIAGPFSRTYATSATSTAVYDATTLFPVGDGTNYTPIHIDPVNGGGPVVMSAQAFNTNSGNAGTGVASTLSNDRWEALVSSGSANLTSCFIGLNDAQIASGNVIAQSSSASGTYNAVSGTSTYTAGTPNSLRTGTAIPAASYTGYFTYAAPGPVITSFTPTSACPNAATTITITGTNLLSATSVTLNGEACTITNNTATSITITTDATPQAGNIVVTTAANSATSPSAMTLFTLPTVTASSNAASNTVCSGTSVTLNGGGATSYTWNNSVTNNVAFTPSTSTTYTVTGTDGNGCTNTASITLTVNQIVAIATQPASQVVLPNATATFSVSASGTGLSYQWEESIDNGATWNNITDGGIYSGATSNTLVLTGVTSGNSGNQYRVVITGTAPCAALTSNAATLTISTTAITAQPQNQTICSSTGTATFSISTSGTTPTYQWQVSTDGGTTWTDILNETSASLSLSGLTLSDSAKQYRCQLNSGAVTSNAAVLTVYDPPVIGTQPSNLTVCSNATSGNFTVAATGSNLSYQWQRSIDAGATWSNISGATTATLSFTSYTTAMDGYQYKVIVSGSSPCSAATSNVATLNVTGIVSVAASSATTCANSAITLTATPTTSASGLNYSWSSSTGSGASTAVTTNPASITPTAAGTYTYTLATTGGGCTFSNTVNVTVNAPSIGGTASAASSSLCQSGSTTISLSGNTGTIQWQSSSDNVNFSNVSGQTTSSLSTGTISSTTYYRAVVTSGVCAATNSSTATVTVNNPQVLTTTPGSICSTGGSVTLAATASSGATLNWYAASTGGAVLAIGSSYTTPSISSTTTYYVSASQDGSTANNLGRLAPAGTSGTTPSSYGLIFTLNQRARLNSVDVFNSSSTTAKTLVIQLQDNLGNIIYTSSTFNIPAATVVGSTSYTCNLGWDIPSGSGYRLLGISGTALIRESNIGGFPYSLGSLGSITNGYILGTSTNYYYFYNWSLTQICESSISSVTATVTTPPTISTSASTSTICNGASTTLSVSSANSGYTYAWSNSLGSGASVSASPTTTTTYTVTATDNSGGANNGCSATGTVAITVNPVPSAISLTPSNTQNICAGNIQSIVASGGVLSNFNFISEDFNNGFGSWVVTNGNNSPSVSNWTAQTSPLTDASGSATFSNFSTTNGGNFAYSNPDAGGSGTTTNSILTSPTFNTLNATSAVLTFEHVYMKWNSGDQTVALEISTDNGSTWAVLKDYMSLGNQGTTTNNAQVTTNESITLANSYLNQSSLKIRFNYVSTWGYFWIIDNVKVTGNLTSTISWSPTTELYTDAAATTAYSGTPTTVYSKPTANRTYTATATTSNGCTASASVTLNYSGTPLATAPANNAYVFGATTNTNYNTAANWYTYSSANGYAIASAVPTSSDVVVIPATSTCVKALPSLSATSSITDVEIQSGAVLSLNGNSLSIAGALSGTGTIKGSSTSSLSFTGSASNTLRMDQTILGTTNVLRNLTLSGTGTTTLANALNITAGASSGSVTAGTGTTLTTGGYLILKSDASGTARIAQSAGTISGNVTQERYVPGKAVRKWSFLASPVTQSLASAWQQQIHITGPGTGGTMCNNYTISGTMTPHSNGFDVTQLQNPSFYTYNATSNNFVANTSGTSNFTLTPGEGYMVLVRGDRNDATNGGCVLLSANNQAAFTSIPVTLAATGAVGQGTITKVLPAGYSLIGNPYPCELDFNQFNTTNGSVISGGYWTYYPTNATYTFSTFNNGISTNGGTQVIANGQSFLVNSTSGGTITFNEAHKSTTANNGGFRLHTTWDELIRVGLSNNQGNRFDEVVVRFGNDAAITTSINEYDAASVNGGDHWIKTLKNNTELAIQTRPNTYQNDTVALAIHAKNAGTYQLGFSEYQGLSNTEVYLIDQQENLIQNVKALPSYDFSVAANTTTANRFKLIFNAKTSGVGSIASNTQLQVYPNPTKDKVSITCNSLEYGAYQVKVRTITGAEVLQAKGFYKNGDVIELSLNDLAVGMYLLELSQDNGFRATQKITKH